MFARLCRRRLSKGWGLGGRCPGGSQDTAPGLTVPGTQSPLPDAESRAGPGPGTTRGRRATGRPRGPQPPGFCPTPPGRSRGVWMVRRRRKPAKFVPGPRGSATAADGPLPLRLLPLTRAPPGLLVTGHFHVRAGVGRGTEVPGDRTEPAGPGVCAPRPARGPGGWVGLASLPQTKGTFWERSGRVRRLRRRPRSCFAGFCTLGAVSA